MHRCWLGWTAGCLAGAAALARAAGFPPAPPVVGASYAVRAPAAVPPTLPPLLPVPTTAPVPPAEQTAPPAVLPAPTGGPPAVPAPPPDPSAGPGEYDPARHYLPDTLPFSPPPPQPCGPAGRFWVETELLGWTIRGTPLPPLVTAGPATVLGDDRLDSTWRPGLRLETGIWLDPLNAWGVEGSFFYLGNRTQTLTAGVPGVAALLAQPFFNVTTGRPDAVVLSAPGRVAGTAALTVGSDLLGAEANGRSKVWCGDDYRLDRLIGFRALNLTESLSLTTTRAFADPAVGLSQVQDRFHASNTFYGGQIGLSGEQRFGRWYVDAVGKVGFGVTHEIVDVSGLTTVLLPGQLPAAVPVGWLAQATNSGRYVHDAFAVAPEVQVRVGYRLGDHVRTYLGYNFLYVSDVARPGNQIDLGINPVPATALGAAARPALVTRGNDLWAQGISAGLEWRY